MATNNSVSLTQMAEQLKAAMAAIETLKADNAKLAAAAAKPMARITLRVSEKGALSVYGMGRFPVTLYREQWERLLGMADDIRKFIADHEGQLATKASAEAAAAAAPSQQAVNAGKASF